MSVILVDDGPGDPKEMGGGGIRNRRRSSERVGRLESVIGVCGKSVKEGEWWNHLVIWILRVVHVLTKRGGAGRVCLTLTRTISWRSFNKDPSVVCLSELWHT